jgi:S-DNA-T family DNA segregation ATPase FtsK/SpoIIIE
VAILLDALEAAGERGATVAELAVAVGMRKTWVYDRLGELADAGRVARGPHSRWFRQPPDEGGLQTR